MKITFEKSKMLVIMLRSLNFVKVTGSFGVELKKKQISSTTVISIKIKKTTLINNEKNYLSCLEAINKK